MHVMRGPGRWTLRYAKHCLISSDVSRVPGVCSRYLPIYPFLSISRPTATANAVRARQVLNTTAPITFSRSVHDDKYGTGCGGKTRPCSCITASACGVVYLSCCPPSSLPLQATAEQHLAQLDTWPLFEEHFLDYRSLTRTLLSLADDGGVARTRLVDELDGWDAPAAAAVATKLGLELATSGFAVSGCRDRFVVDRLPLRAFLGAAAGVQWRGCCLRLGTPLSAF